MRLAWFEVQGYKNLRHPVRLEDLQPYNVLHGDNGIGKSNLLEAIAAFFELVPWLHAQNMATMPLGERTQLSQPWLSDTNKLIGQLSSSQLEFTKALVVDTLVAQPLRDVLTLPERQPLRLSAAVDMDSTDVQVAVERWPALGAVQAGRYVYSIGVTPLGDGKRGQVELLVSTRDGQVLSPREIWHGLVFLMSLAGALLPPSRRVLPAVGLDKTEGDPYSYRDLIPAELCLKLNDAEQAENAAGQIIWQRFRAALQPFSDLLGGPLGVEWDRGKRRYRLFVRQGDRKLGSWLLAAGLQQVIALVGWLSTHPARLLLLEEPELNLRYTLALRLREALLTLTRGELGKQILLSTHSLAFEAEGSVDQAFFYAMERSGDAIVVRKRPVREAAAFTESLPFVMPPGSAERLPPCWVSGEGLMEVPERIRKKLGVQSGGGVFFVERKDTGHVELLSEEQFYNLLEPRNEPGIDEGKGHGRA